MEAVPDNVAGAAFARYLHDTRACRECKNALTHKPRPVIMADRRARVLIIGQAPGRIVHGTGIPWNNRSRGRLHQWLQISYGDLYTDRRITVVPVGFCFPGTDASGGLPSRPECASRWHRPLLITMPEVRLALLVGTYTQCSYLNMSRDWTPTDVVRSGPAHDADGHMLFPLLHPNLRNLAWLKHNPQFDAHIMPTLWAALTEAFA